MTDNISAINLPFEEAIRFFREKANVTTNSWRDVWGAAHSHSFSVAGAASQALVSDFRGAIDKAIAEGTTLDEFRKDFDTIVTKRGWDHTGDRNWRSRVIFETNMRTALAAGRYAQLTLPSTLEAFPMWMYRHSGALHPRLDHLSWDGQVWRASNPIWSRIYPPNGFGCGCFVIPLNVEELTRLGKSGPDRAPDLEQLVGGSRGIDPSFEYNPGQAWLSGGRPGEPIATAALMKVFERRALAGELPVNTTLPILPIDEPLISAIELEPGANVRVSVATLRDHLPRRPIDTVAYSEFAKKALESDVHVSPLGEYTAIVNVDGLDYAVGFKKSRLKEFLITTVHQVGGRKRRKIQNQPVLER